MATEDPDLMAALESPDWSVVLGAVARAETQIRDSIVGDPKVELIAAEIVVPCEPQQVGGAQGRRECCRPCAARRLRKRPGQALTG